MQEKTLVLGCGNNREKLVRPDGSPEWKGELIRLDMDPNCGADIVWDLEVRPLPFGDNEFDEIHAYDVLEHVGRQGDWRGYFDEFAEYWRILKPGGCLCGMVPVGDDAFADPGHTRFFSANHFAMLNQQWYADSLAKGIRTTDYRWYWKRDFSPVELAMMEGHHLVFMMRKAP